VLLNLEMKLYKYRIQRQNYDQDSAIKSKLWQQVCQSK